LPRVTHVPIERCTNMHRSGPCQLLRTDWWGAVRHAAEQARKINHRCTPRGRTPAGAFTATDPTGHGEPRWQESPCPIGVDRCASVVKPACLLRDTPHRIPMRLDRGAPAKTPCTNSRHRPVRPGFCRGCKNPMHQFRGGSRPGLPVRGAAEPHAPIQVTFPPARISGVAAKPHAPIQAAVAPALVCVGTAEPHAPIRAAAPSARISAVAAKTPCTNSVADNARACRREAWQNPMHQFESPSGPPGSASWRQNPMHQFTRPSRLPRFTSWRHNPMHQFAPPSRRPGFTSGRQNPMHQFASASAGPAGGVPISSTMKRDVRETARSSARTSSPGLADATAPVPA
jgi:hypothetical protein